MATPRPKVDTKECLSLDLRGSLPIEKFEKAIGAFFDLIKEVTKEALNENQKIRWTVTVRSGSATVNAIPHYAPDVAAEARQILRAVPQGIQAIERGSEESPRFFSREAIKAVKRLGALQSLKPDDVTGVRIRSDSVKANITPKSVASADALIGGQHQAFGSIEGKMQTITDREGFRFVVYDSLYDNRVDCFVDEDLMEQAIASFRHRVRVSGTVQYDRQGDPVSVKVNEIYAFPKNSELPSVKRIRGILKERA
ncbi:MAG TPA: hypothetical protein VFA61_06335 [Candidatus Udaeobacter sp.]|nr:hypothetical protein [Candidatus Udaeobacter sp.]